MDVLCTIAAVVLLSSVHQYTKAIILAVISSSLHTATVLAVVVIKYRKLTLWSFCRDTLANGPSWEESARAIGLAVAGVH